MQRSQELDNLLNAILPNREKALKELRCPTCGKPITLFRDALSLKEYHISGMCQECQDSVFNSDEEE